jgi:hypothetical protein
MNEVKKWTNTWDLKQLKHTIRKARQNEMKTFTTSAAKKEKIWKPFNLNNIMKSIILVPSSPAKAFGSCSIFGSCLIFGLILNNHSELSDDFYNNHDQTIH